MLEIALSVGVGGEVIGPLNCCLQAALSSWQEGSSVSVTVGQHFNFRKIRSGSEIVQVPNWCSKQFIMSLFSSISFFSVLKCLYFMNFGKTFAGRI